MNLPIKTMALALALMCAAETCRADNIALVAAYACNRDGGRFSVMADVLADDEKARPFEADEYQVQLSIGDHELSCELSGLHINARIIVMEAGNGMCQGAGGALLKKLLINGKEHLILDSYLHPLDCIGGRGLVKLTIILKAKAAATIEVCRGPPWDWDRGWHDIHCEQEALTERSSGRSKTRAAER